MKKTEDIRPQVYARYVAPSGGEGFHAYPLPDHLGDTLYGRHLAGVDREALVMEVGAGAGHFLAYLRRRGFQRLIGVDLADDLVREARAQGLEVAHGDALVHLAGLPENSCGAVVAIDVIEHFTKPELLNFLREAMRVLQPGGVLLLQTVNGEGLFPGQVMFGDLTHETILNPVSLGRTLTLTGFGAATFLETGPLGVGWKDDLRRWLWRAIKGMLNFIRWVEARKRQDVWTENMICCCRKPG